MAEFLGVAVITSVILAVSKSGVGFSVFIASGVGMAVTALTLVFGPRIDAQFNPAVTLGLWTTRKLATSRAIMALATQFLGGLAAWRLYEFLTAQPLAGIAGKGFDWRVLAAEAAGAFVLTFGVVAAVYQGYRGLKLAATVGAAFFLGILIASIASNGVVNPAVAVGLRSWSRAYALGPLLGGVLGANLYALLYAERPKKVVAAAIVPADAADASITAPAKKKRLVKRGPRKQK
jgi:glycerol uptake facilitator-like aquaporin